MLQRQSIRAPRGKQAPFEIICLNWRPCPRNTLRGFARIKIFPWGLIINDITVHTQNGKEWATFAGTPQLDENRELVREPGGKIRYYPHLWFEIPDLTRTFSTEAVRAVKKFLGGSL
jgi:hypothetical protein